MWSLVAVVTTDVVTDLFVTGVMVITDVVVVTYVLDIKGAFVCPPQPPPPQNLNTTCAAKRHHT
jgi:hypothetical protein